MYAGVVQSSKKDDAYNPTEYTVLAKKYWGLNPQGKKAWIDKSEEPFTVPASLVKANPSRSGTGFVQGS
ncbi:hypothetical protein SLS63_013454 [Diaporthe eres]|uniref:Uncharacterized protein n=1 Tax=Diaporthe eres TaxID=83184 RepID=A0ABR1NNG4_DIAER